MKIGFYSRKIASLPNLDKFLNAEPLWIVPGVKRKVAMIGGWGRNPATSAAQRNAARIGLPFVTLDEGFVGSVEPDACPTSLVVDDLGIYYDSSCPSRLETIIAGSLTGEQVARTRRLIEEWRNSYISKYNIYRDFDGELPSRYVLVCDQALDDPSVQLGNANKNTFTLMLETAIKENPNCAIVIKMDNDIADGQKGFYSDIYVDIASSRKIYFIKKCHSARIIQNADAVYTVTSHLGFEALIWNKRVRVFGMPFYAGWKLTEDEQTAPNNRQGASLEQLVYSALISYSRYVDPETSHRCEVERIVSYITLQRNAQQRFPPKIYAINFSRWKRPFLRQFVAGSEVQFLSATSKIPAHSTVLIWGKYNPRDLPVDVNLIRVEDGFLRSVGLGAEQTPPASWVFDDLGIYYDAAHMSRLEYILSESCFDERLLARANKIHELIVKGGITKYNLSQKVWVRPEAEGRVILVPGQVENDLSLIYGSAKFKTNWHLLRAVREDNPHAYVVYKPHPDVVAGLRPGSYMEEDLEKFCDCIVREADMAQILGQVDEVATLTSLTGFEALLRHKKVTCYGMPFYAGWGLTQDIVPHPRRQRKIALNELVAGALIIYPTYISSSTNNYTTPERVILELIERRVGRLCNI